ncbi:MAG: hypothetical protein U1D55_00430 [Phycisphaerae bacterium]
MGLVKAAMRMRNVPGMSLSGFRRNLSGFAKFVTVVGIAIDLAVPANAGENEWLQERAEWLQDQADMKMADAGFVPILDANGNIIGWMCPEGTEQKCVDGQCCALRKYVRRAARPSELPAGFRAATYSPGAKAG